MDAHRKGFGSAVLGALTARDARAARLRLTTAPRARDAVIGLDDAGDFVPLLRLDTASAAGNVMSLSVYHHGQWQPTFERGTPGELAERLAGPLQHLWTIAVAAADFDPDASVQ
ncbi:MAG: hypothetical protein MUF64_27390 [Polyangiaceae bacterium]|jgi:hypothetical protein|nr:hypothetical protein [Polyangiaceae bacterium]